MSAIWEIELYKNVDSGGECLECSIIIKTSGGNTTGLITHLKQHPAYLEKFIAKRDKINTKNENIEKFVQIRGHGDLSALDKKVINYLSCTCTPFNVVDHPTFHSLFPVNHPLEVIKVEKHYRSFALQSVYECVKNRVKEDLNKCDYLSFTCDVWHGGNESYISLTGHGISKSWERINFILCCQEFCGMHDSINITKSVKEMLRKWEIDENKIHVFLRDGAASMKKAFEGTFEHADCAAHKINLCIQKSMDTFKELIEKSRKIVGHFNQWKKHQEKFENDSTISVQIAIANILIGELSDKFYRHIESARLKLENINVCAVSHYLDPRFKDQFVSNRPDFLFKITYWIKIAADSNENICTTEVIEAQGIEFF
uniref:Transposase n=1 Tax=Meloidogyne javanica TaxID=6303 RepID=A0A915MYW9_MELJA